MSMKNISRQLLAKKVAERTGLDLISSRKAVNATVESIAEEIAVLNRVTLHGLGVFKFKRRAGFLARNPRTGEPMPIPPHRKIDFQPAPSLRMEVMRARVQT